MPLACKLCIMIHGLNGSELDKLPKTEEEFYAHLKEVHGITVLPDGDVHAATAIGEPKT